MLMKIIEFVQRSLTVQNAAAQRQSHAVDPNTIGLSESSEMAFYSASWLSSKILLPDLDILSTTLHHSPQKDEDARWSHRRRGGEAIFRDFPSNP
jgi:hypothetical protein